ncbi:hypothetical protein [Burkholderia ubonensis]|uniref:hypothetical protein n=1 Tax=Burkholderia ubonensis TaxID=101571 RepID=UPI000B15284F|nr:hypothetical protein [Burkholderia ubonensis]
MLMQYVGWKDVRSAMRYIDAADPFAQHRVESALAATTTTVPPEPMREAQAKLPPPAAETRLNLHLFIERSSKFVRGLSIARRWIEDFCLAAYGTRRLNTHRSEYEIVMPYAHGPELERAIADLLVEMHSTADLCNCWIEASLHDPPTDTY